MTITIASQSEWDDYVGDFNDHPYMNMVGRIIKLPDDIVDDNGWDRAYFLVIEVRTHRTSMGTFEGISLDALAMALDDERLNPVLSELQQITEDDLEFAEVVPYNEDPCWLRVLRISQDWSMDDIREEGSSNG